MKLPSNIQTEKPKRDLKGRIILFLKIIAISGGILLVYWFARKSNLDEIMSQIGQIHFRFVYLIAITFAGFVIVSYAWKLCFYEKNNIPVSQLFVIRLIGESLSQVNPANVLAGDALKAVLLKARGIPYRSGIISITVSRFMIIISNIALIIAGIIFYFDLLHIISGKVGLAVLVIIFLSLPLAMHHLLQSGRGIFFIPIALITLFKNAVKKERFQKTIENLREMDRELIEFYRTKKARFFMIFLLSLMHWIVGWTEYFIILTLLGISATFISCIALGVGIAVIRAVCSFIPGQIGVEEYGHKLMLDFLNISGSDVWLTVSILRRGRQMFWLCAGLVAFLFMMKFNTNNKEIKDGSVVYNS